jgi:pimeloyl-ACP methyl ester carboxylesterase
LPEISHPVSTKTSNLYATAVGKGRPLLFIHGFGANSYTWSKISGPLRENYRLILLDLKGHGRAPKPKDGAYSLHDQAELVTSFIIDNKLEDLTIVGHSLGGGVALLVTLKLASKIPNPISSLILIDSVAYSQALPGFIRILRIPILAELLLWLVPNRLQTLQVLKRAYYDSTKITDETLEAYSRPLSLPGAHHALIESAKQIIPEDIEEIRRRYQTIGIPTLLIWGKHDRIVELDFGERLHRSIPNSELVVIEEAGHVPQEETPAATLEAMMKFLRFRS